MNTCNVYAQRREEEKVQPLTSSLSLFFFSKADAYSVRNVVAKFSLSLTRSLFASPRKMYYGILVNALYSDAFRSCSAARAISHIYTTKAACARELPFVLSFLACDAAAANVCVCIYIADCGD